MEREHETTVRFVVEVQRKHRNGWENWFSTPSFLKAEQVIEKLRADGLTARVVKETTTVVREVVDENLSTPQSEPRNRTNLQ